MKRILYHSLGLLLCLSAFSFTLNAQKENMPENKPVKNTFNSIWIYNNPSVMVPIVGTFEMDFQHRFGTINNGFEDLFGIYAPFADVRLGFEYVPVKKLMVGFGINRTGLTWDLNAKYAIFQQMQSGGSPVSLTYYVNAGIRTEDKIKFPVPDQVEFADRVSYYHTLMVARKFSDRLSVQLAGSVSHYNTVVALQDDQQNITDEWKNDHLAVNLAVKYHITPVLNVLVGYDQPLTNHAIFDPQPNLSFGVELVTSSHQFQFFMGNFPGTLPQQNNVFNVNKIGDGDFLIGFNIVRLWNF